MKIATSPVAVEYGVVMIAVSVPVSIAGVGLASLVNQIFANLLPQVAAVAMAVGG